MTTINFSKSLVLKVNQADNSLKVGLSPDRYKKGADIYATDNFSDPKLNDSIDIFPYAILVGQDCILAAVGANFEGGGAMKWRIEADGATVMNINENLATWSSKMWTAKLHKV